MLPFNLFAGVKAAIAGQAQSKAPANVQTWKEDSLHETLPEHFVYPKKNVPPGALLLYGLLGCLALIFIMKDK